MEQKKNSTMHTKNKQQKISQTPLPEKHPEIEPSVDPEEPLIPPEEDPDLIPDDDPYKTPPYEIPPPGEGP